MPDCRRYLESNDYIDILVRYSDVISEQLEQLGDYCITRLDDRWSIIHLSREEFRNITYGEFGYSSLPLVYGLQDYGAAENVGVLQAREQPFLDLRGSGCLIGIIDTGIFYQHEAFVNEDGSSKIEAIWDQTGRGQTGSVANADMELVALAPYGSVYTQPQINEALSAGREGGNPLDIVPVTDEPSGHGSFLAGIAAGNEKPDSAFTGMAPEANLVVVKLQQAKAYLREFYLVRDGVPCYSETDILMGIRFLDEYAERVRKPISIIIGLGTNMASHSGSSVLSDYLENIARNLGRCVSIAAGNYANARLHFSGEVNEFEDFVPVEINVSERETGFVCTLWADAPDLYALEFVSPTGQVEEKIPVRTDNESSLRFNLEGTQVQLYYGINQALSGQNYAIIKFITPSAGVWTIRVYPQNVLYGRFNMWLSNREFMSSDTYFLRSDPYETITDPGNAVTPITVGAYDYRDNSMYIGSGRGNTASGRIKPDIIAPGVNILGPSNTIPDSYTTKTGTSIAAAIAGGASALMLEYGIVRGFYPYLRTYTIKNFLISGANRREDFKYPNRIEGYGRLDIYQAIERLAGR